MATATGKAVKVRGRRYDISEKQFLFRSSRAFIRGFVAGRGAGKTKIGSIDMLCRAKRGRPYMIVSPTAGDIETTTWPTFKETAEELGLWRSGVRSPIHKAWCSCQGGGQAEFIFRSGDEPSRLRGPSMAGLWIDEASVMHEDVFRVGAPMLRWRGKLGHLALTFTPRGRMHWTYELFFERRGDDWGPKEDWPKDESGLTSEDFLTCGFERYAQLVQAHTLENPFAPKAYYASLRPLYSEALAAQELAGEFVDVLGLMFQRHWFGFVERSPKEASRVRYWDKAATPEGGSYTAGVLMAKTADGEIYVEDVRKGQWSWRDRNKIMLQTAAEDGRRHGNQVHVYVEQEPGSGGKESAQQTVRLLGGFPVFIDVVRGKVVKSQGKEKLPGEAKVVRAQPFVGQCEAGNVKLVRAGWNDDYLTELCAFPEYRYSDQVDASSGAYNKLAKVIDFSVTQPSRLDMPMAASSDRGIHFVKQARRQRRGRQ
jgi:predicted phage terminase large subunit-like protein